MLDGDREKIAVPQVDRPVPVGTPHGFDDEMNALVLGQGIQRITGQDIQHGGEHHTPGRRRRHHDDTGTLVLQRDRWAFDDPVGDQIL